MGDKYELINSLNHSEAEVLQFLFKDPNIKVKDIATELYRGEGGVRTNLTAIFTKLGAPDTVANKREWVVSEYSDAYEYVYHRDEWEAKQKKLRLESQPEIYINPPDPIVVGATPAVTEAPEQSTPEEETAPEAAQINWENLQAYWSDLSNKIVVSKDEWLLLKQRPTRTRLFFIIVLCLGIGFYLGAVYQHNFPIP